MSKSVMVISSNETILEETEILLKRHYIDNIITCKNKDEAIKQISSYMEIDLIILDQDLKDNNNDKAEKVFNGENIAIKLMRDGIEVPTLIVGTHPIEYEDDNTIYKVNIATENLSDAIDNTLNLINNMEI